MGAGGIGLGFVWGWWTAPYVDHRSRWRSAPLILTVAILQAAEAVWLTGWASLAFLFGGWLVGFLLHRAFRNALRARPHESTTF